MVVHEEGEIMPTEQDLAVEVFMDLTMLHCPFCLRPLKPLVYEGGHLACADCRGERPGNQRQCQKCERGSGFDVHNTAMDAVLSSVRVEFSHEGYGLYATYHKLDDHQSVCPLAPCKCPVPGCGYEGPPPALPHHLSTVHPMPMHMIQYGKVLQLQVPVSKPQCLLYAEEDGRAFSWSAARSASVRLLSCRSCASERGRPLPHYAAKVWANGPPGSPNSRTDAVMVEIKVTSSKEPDAVAVEELTFLTVPPKLLAGAGSSRAVSLHIRIDKFTS